MAEPTAKELRTGVVPPARRCAYCGQAGGATAFVWHIAGCPNDAGYVPESMRPRHLFRTAP